MSDKKLRDEIGELTEAMRELRGEMEKLRAERTAHHHCGHSHCNWGHCWCSTVHGYAFGSVTYPGTWTVTSGATGTVTATNGYLTND